MKDQTISLQASNLINAIDEFINASSKTNYIFTIEEQHQLENMIKVLNNQISFLVDYEIKRSQLSE